MPLSPQAQNFMAKSTGVDPALTLSQRLDALIDQSPEQVAANPPQPKKRKPGKAQVEVEKNANTP